MALLYELGAQIHDATGKGIAPVDVVLCSDTHYEVYPPELGCPTGCPVHGRPLEGANVASLSLTAFWDRGVEPEFLDQLSGAAARGAVCKIVAGARSRFKRACIPVQADGDRRIDM